MIETVVNGERTELESELTLAAWLEAKGRDARTVAIELNGDIVPRARFGETTIRHGDRLEVVAFVQGG
ncbi:MAG: sulfur carrier protein ThiS [Acidobacteriota bacterium]